jgi:hypothetical protein
MLVGERQIAVSQPEALELVDLMVTRSVSEGQFRRSLTDVSGYDW